MCAQIFWQDLKNILNQDAPPDAETWKHVRDIVRSLEDEVQSNNKILEQFMNIFLSSSVAQSLTEFDGTISQINAKGAELVEYTREELVGKRFIDLQVYADPQQRKQMLDTLLREGLVRNVEVELRAKSGKSVILIMNWDIFVLDERKYILSTFYDVTQFRNSEIQFRQMHVIAQRQAQESALLHQVRTVLAQTVDLPTMIHAVVEGIVDTFGYELVSLYLIEDNTLVLQHHHGYHNVIPRVPLYRGITGRSVLTKQPILITDVRTDPDFLGAIPGVLSEISVPLMLKDEVVGVLNVETTDEVILSEADLRVMVALGEHISISMQRARLYSNISESERNARQQRLFAEALRDTAAGLNATLELDPMIELILKNIRHVMPEFQAARIAFVRANKLQVVAQRGYPDGTFKDPINVKDLDGVEEMIRTQNVCIYRDCWEHPGRLVGTPLDWVRSIIAAPVIFERRVIGIIYLDSNTPNTFDDIHADLLKAFADQAGIALQKAQLYKRLRRQTKMRMRQAMEYGRRVTETRAKFGIAISHEFRTPLTTIQTSADLMRLYDDRLTPARRRDLLGKINTQVKHLTHLLDDIMLLSRSEMIGVQLNQTLIDLDQLCHDVAAEIQWIAGDKHRIIFIGDGLCQNATLDEDLMRRVLINLLTNAIKYSPEGGKVLFTLNREDNDAVIEVTDHGIGIPAADLERLFHTFHRAGNVGSIPGTGLGLTLVKQAIELQSGTIRVESTEGVRTTFTVRMPLSPTKV